MQRWGGCQRAFASGHGPSLSVPPMKCPFCQLDNDRVIDSRACDDGFAIRRRRECLDCKRRYTTYERFEELAIKVVKKGGAREPYSREKIRDGLAKACWKRPISDAQIETIISRVESSIYGRVESEIDSRSLGELVMKELGGVDQVAFVRFASVYRDFADVSDFIEELEPILALKAKRDGSGELSPEP